MVGTQAKRDMIIASASNSFLMSIITPQNLTSLQKKSILKALLLSTRQAAFLLIFFCGRQHRGFGFAGLIFYRLLYSWLMLVLPLAAVALNPIRYRMPGRTDGF